MKKKLLLLSLICTSSVFAQVGITDSSDANEFTTTAIEESAVLEIRSDSKGLLLPRLTTSAITTLESTAVAGLMVYDTDQQCFKAWDGTAWQVLGADCTVTNTAPTASSVAISGSATVGETVTGTYTYSDADNDTESGSTFVWQTSTDNSTYTDISGETTTSLVVPSSEGEYIRFCVTPNDGTDAGTQVCSDGSVIAAAVVLDVRLNEIHYDDAGADANEFVEVRAALGTDISDYTVTLYNGSNGTSYGSELLSNMTKTSDASYDYYVWEPSSIQNGNPDGFSLTTSSSVVEFLSYGGTFAATNGSANGETSTDIGASESDSAEDSSIERSDDGSTWTANSGANTKGIANFTTVAPDTTVEFSTASATVAESVGTTDFTLSIANPDASTATTAEVALTSGDAAALGNYTTQTLTWAAGDSADKTVTVTVSSDDGNTTDDDYVFTLQTISGGNNAAAGTNGTFTLTVEDSTTAYTLSIADATAVTEGSDQTFTVTLSPALVSGDTVTVDYISLGDTATEGTDYTAASGTLTFSTAGQTTQDITVTTTDDTDIETDESYNILIDTASVTAGTGTVSISTDTATGTINDNDSAAGYSDNFESQTFSSSYGTNSFSGDDDTTWSATASRDDAGYEIEGDNALMLRRNSDSTLTIVFPNGLDTLSFDYRKAYTSSGARRIVVSKTVGGTDTTLFTSADFGASSGADATIHSTGNISVGETGSVTITIKPDTGKQLCVDNFSWTR